MQQDFINVRANKAILIQISKQYDIFHLPYKVWVSMFNIL